MLECSIVEDGKILESRFIHVGDMPVMAKSTPAFYTTLSNQSFVNSAKTQRDPGGVL